MGVVCWLTLFCGFLLFVWFDLLGLLIGVYWFGSGLLVTWLLLDLIVWALLIMILLGCGLLLCVVAYSLRFGCFLIGLLVDCGLGWILLFSFCFSLGV